MFDVCIFGAYAFILHLNGSAAVQQQSNRVLSARQALTIVSWLWQGRWYAMPNTTTPTSFMCMDMTPRP